MKQKSFLRFLGFQSGNLKSKSGPADKNLKIVGLVALAVAFALFGAVVDAQQAGKVTRIAYLDGSTAVGSAELLDEFRKQMTQFNWIEGKNVTVEYRYGEGKGATRIAEFAVELVGLKPDVIVVQGTSGALAAKKATSTIPIVMVNVGDPVERGLTTSLARPGGNITGLTTFSDDLGGKRIEILKECSLNPHELELLPALEVQEVSPK